MAEVEEPAPRLTIERLPSELLQRVFACAEAEKRGDSVGRLGLGAANRLCGKGGRYDRLISTYLKSSVKQRFFEPADGLPEQRVGALQWWQLAQQRAHWKTFVDSISLY